MVPKPNRVHNWHNPADSLVSVTWKSNEHKLHLLDQFISTVATTAGINLHGAATSGIRSLLWRSSINNNDVNIQHWDYFSFMAMGMVAFTTVFTTAFVGISVVFDRRLGFMNKVLSTPVSRSVIILSKVLSASIRSVFQAAIVTIIAYLLGLQLGRKLYRI